jgi:UDP-N-acetylmuramoylalanine--D-glutamate ligase
MFNLTGKNVLVIGLDPHGQAACELLSRQQARVVGVDAADTEEVRLGAERLRSMGVEVFLGLSRLPKADFSLAVVSPVVSVMAPLVQETRAAGLRLVSELELGCQQAHCLTIAIAGTNGKGTTAELVERLLTNTGRKTLVAGYQTLPVCSVVEQTSSLDFLIVEASAFQLELTHEFRPAVAVLLNLAADHLDRYPNADDYARATAPLFCSQQSFDWAIVQSEALSVLRRLELPVPGKIITFSASDPEADLRLERGLLISRLPNWAGPLLDLDQCQIRGPHNAENLMAALAVGHALRVPLEAMAEALKVYSAGPHRCELVAEIDGVQYINDAKARNLDALQKALLTVRPGATGQANVWLIAGGQDGGLEYHDVGPVLSKRVKRAFLFGDAREKMRAAWSLFTPCTVVESLIQAVDEATGHAPSGDVVLFSPACPSIDQYQNEQQRGEEFCRKVKSIGRGAPGGTPNINGKTATT